MAIRRGPGSLPFPPARVGLVGPTWCLQGSRQDAAPWGREATSMCPCGARSQTPGLCGKWLAGGRQGSYQITNAGPCPGGPALLITALEVGVPRLTFPCLASEVQRANCLSEAEAKSQQVALGASSARRHCSELRRAQAPCGLEEWPLRSASQGRQGCCPAGRGLSSHLSLWIHRTG